MADKLFASSKTEHDFAFQVAQIVSIYVGNSTSERVS